MQSFWLFKTEPETYSFETLLKQKKTHWDNVRNYQARNFLRDVKKGDSVFIYHSGDERAIVGIAEITREAYPDPDPHKPGDWVQVDLAPVRKLKNAIALKQIKAEKELASMLLIKQSRLSCIPVTKEQFHHLLSMENIQK